MALNLNYKPNKLVDITTLTEDQWLDWRRKGIGGSDVAVALNSSPYRTARELYCTTIHKSQGQEYPVIIVPLLKEHYIMLRRNLLYTAVTRAKAKVILIGQKQAVFIAIHKCDVGQRNTVLADRIVAYYNRELSKRVT